MESGEQAVREIRESGVTKGGASVVELNLKSLKSVQRFAQTFNERHKYLNLLVNNGWYRVNYIFTWLSRFSRCEKVEDEEEERNIELY